MAYVKDFFKAMWKMAVVSIIAAIGAFVGIKEHMYILASVCSIVLVVCGVIWAPWIEEGFKLKHSETKGKALIFGFVEMLAYSWQIPASFGLWVVLRLPTLIMHSASSLCYHHNPNTRMRWFWYVNHALWNAIAIYNVRWLYNGNNIYNVHPTMLTICITLFWTTSFLFKLFRKKQVVIC